MPNDPERQKPTANTGEPTRRATGPRTREGKLRSKYNAQTHGICSKELLLTNESQSEFELLRKGIFKNFRPHGTMETETVDDLVVVRWNKRRVRKAINAIFAEKIGYSEFDRCREQEGQAWDAEQWGGAQGGMLKPDCNHFVLKEGIDRLKRIRNSLQDCGFNIQKDRDSLKTLYGTDTDGRPRSGVFDLYLILGTHASVNREGEQNPDPDRRKNLMLKVFDEEIERLSELRSVVVEVELERIKLRDDQTLLSRQAVLDLYIRYDTYLSRETDRLLNRLERLQGMREGQ